MSRAPRTAEERSAERRERIYATVDAIPAGRVASYGLVASEAGLPGRARLVGRLLGELPAGSDVPWFRVVNAAGRISVKGPSARRQRQLLRAEGVEVSANGRIDLCRFGWEG